MTDKQLVVQCIRMLEKYLIEASCLLNDSSKKLMLADLNMAKWKNTC